MAKKFALIAGLLFAGSPAAADTTAVYQAKSKAIPMTMSVEVGNDGSVRYQMSAGRTYGLVLGGVDYFVTLESKGPVVDRADDLVAAQKEAMAGFMPGFSNQDSSSGPQLVPIGKATINGRIGQAYGYEKGTTAATGVVFNDKPDFAQMGAVTTREVTESEKDRMVAATVAVISDEPDLAQLGRAMAKQFGISATMLARMIGHTPGAAKEMQAILEMGAPLSFGGMKLNSVNHAPIDPKRFELPGQPETLDQIRERMKPLPPPPTAPLTKP